ncbi:MAG TPA: DUF5615 family PIN-like protein [Candidatus Saccharimonadales bacterium]|nr:DUF5615 family PIN-like protein [Candidatus Saccharimonadales bacterium]
MPSKKSRLHIYADECIPVTSIINLKQKGVSAIHAYDINFIQKPDKIHLKKSKELNRILLSFDRDFKQFKHFPLLNHPGVILLSTGDTTPEHVNKILDKVLKHITVLFMRNSLVIVTMNKIIREKEGVKSEKNI